MGFWPRNLAVAASEHSVIFTVEPADERVPPLILRITTSFPFTVTTLPRYSGELVAKFDRQSLIAALKNTRAERNEAA